LKLKIDAKEAKAEHISYVVYYFCYFSK